MKSGIFKKAFRDTIPVMMGYIPLGIGFGLIMQTQGYGWYWAAAMGVFIFAGSMQYVAVELLSGGAGLITTALTTLLVNARHLFYGLSLLDKYKDMGKAKPYLIFGLTDETYSLVCSDKEDVAAKDRKKYYLLVTLLDHIYWITGCTLGGIVGSVITFNTEGIDFALTALFISIVVEQWLSSDNHLPAIIGIAASALCVVLFGPSGFLIPAMISITAILLLLGKKVK